MLPLFLEFLTFSFDDEMLIEANILNIKDKLNQDTSIHEYLKQYTELLGTPEMKNAFVKKIATLLINDERFHQAVRELPPEAPDWAKKAQQEQQLYAFVPNLTLNEMLTHLVHYLSTAEHDSKNAPTNDAKVFAQRELQGFPKAESLDLLDKKAKEYFARGAKKETRDVAGMEQVMEVNGGFVWYKLIEPDAFRREGKTLQNCIGSIYTAERCRQQKEVILVLRDASNNSVVATRIREEGKDNWIVQEMKGKQNRPPVAKYMPPVVQLFSKMKLKLGPYAERDLTNAGFYYHDGKLYTKTEAIKTLVPFTEIEKIGYGLTLGKISWTDLVSKLYSQILHYNNKAELYESRDSSGNPVVSVRIDGKILEAVWYHPTEQVVAEDQNTIAQLSGSSKESLLIRETIAALFKQDIVTSFSSKVNKEFFWNRKEVFDPETKEFKPIVPDEEHKFGADETEWKEYTNPQVIQTVLNSLNAYRYSGKEFMLPDIKKIKSVIMTGGALPDEDDDDGDQKIKPHRMLFRDKNNVAYPAVVTGGYSGGEPDRFAAAMNTPDYMSSDDIADENVPLTKSLVSLANKQGLELTPTAQALTGVFKNDKGKYEKIKVEAEPVGTKGATKIDFSKYPEQNRAEAIHYVLHHPEIAHIKDGKKKRIFELDFGATKQIQPTHLYRVPIQYGSKTAPDTHVVSMLTKGNEAVLLDVPTRGSQWKRWDDYDTVMKQLNAFIDENKLTVNDSATKDREGRVYRNRGQIVSTKGKFDLRSNIEQRRIERNVQRGRYGAEGADAVPFVGGQKVVRANPQEQATFMRTVVGASKRGEMWKVLDAGGAPRAVFFVQGKQIVAAYYDYSLDAVGEGELNKRINNPGFGRYLRFIKGAADKFGWTFKPFKSMSLARDSDYYDQLSLVNGHGDEGKNVDVATATRHRDLADAGLITITDAPLSHSGKVRYKLKITPEGKRIFQRMRDGEPAVYMSSMISPAPVTDEFKIEKKEKPAVPAGGAPGAAPATAREGTKADMAVTRFREMMAANNNTPPSRQEFMRAMAAAPFNMSPAGAQTYYYNTKQRVARIVGENTELGRLLLADIPNGPFALFNEFLAKSTS